MNIIGDTYDASKRLLYNKSLVHPIIHYKTMQSAIQESPFLLPFTKPYNYSQVPNEEFRVIANQDFFRLQWLQKRCYFQSQLSANLLKHSY